MKKHSALFFLFFISVLFLVFAQGCRKSSDSAPAGPEEDPDETVTATFVCSPTVTFTRTKTATAVHSSTLTSTFSPTATSTSTFTATVTLTPTETIVVKIYGNVNNLPYAGAVSYSCSLFLDGTKTQNGTVSVRDVTAGATPVPMPYVPAAMAHYATETEGADYVYGHVYEMTVNIDSRTFTAQGEAGGDFTFHSNGDWFSFNYPAESGLVFIYDESNGNEEVYQAGVPSSPHNIDQNVYTAGHDYRIGVRREDRKYSSMGEGFLDVDPASSFVVREKDEYYFTRQ